MNCIKYPIKILIYMFLFIYVFLSFQGSFLKGPWGTRVTLKLFAFIQSCYMLRYMVLGSMDPELHDLRMVCLLQGVTSAWVTNTKSFTLVIDHIRYCGSFEVFPQMIFIGVEVKCLLSVGPARRVRVP